MHFVIVSCVFPPEPLVSGQTSIHIAEELLKQGNKVTVITSFPNRPAGKLFPGFSRSLYSFQKAHNGLEIIRCFSVFSSKSSLWSRLLENLSFGLTSGCALLFVNRPNAIYCNTWPILATGMIWLFAKLRRIPLVISVQDIYPESLIIQKRLSRESRLARILRAMDKIITRGAQAILVISENFKRIYIQDRKVTEGKLFLIPNWIKENAITIYERENQIREAHCIPNDVFLIVFGGNIGMAAGVETVIESFRFLGDAQNIYLLIAGEGNNLKNCLKLGQEINSSRILFHSPWAPNETSLVLCSADLLILPTQGEQSLASVPSKLISYMLSERPVLALSLSDSDITHVIHESECGWVEEPDKPEKLAAILREISKIEPPILRYHGQAGRQYAKKYLTQSANLARVTDIIVNIANKHKP